MKIKMPDGIVYDENRNKCQSLKYFLTENPKVEIFSYPMYNFNILCRKLFVTPNNCLVMTNGKEQLIDLEYCEVYKVIS